MGIALIWMLFGLAIVGPLAAVITVADDFQANPILDASCGGPEIVKVLGITDDLVITDVNFGLIAEHTYRGDLRLTLESPSGTVVELISSDGGDGNAHFNLLLDDEAGGTINDGNLDDPLAAFPERSAAPSNPLSAFDGETSEGLWVMNLCDSAGGDIGVYRRAQLVIDGTPAVACAPDEIGGRAFRDFDGNGTRALNEGPIAGLSVRVFDATGEVGADTTGADGRFLVSGLAAGAHRVEFAGLVLGDDPSGVGSDSTSSVQFVAAGSCEADFAANNPNEFCDANPSLATNCYIVGDQAANSTDDVLVSFPFDAESVLDTATPSYPGSVFRDDPAPVHLAVASEIGPTWGLAYQRTTQTLFASAFFKRHVGMGPGDGSPASDGTGTIYSIDVSGGAPVIAPLIDLDSLLGAGTTGGDPRVGLSPYDYARDNLNDGAGGDVNTVWASVGKLAFGDLDITGDNTLWTVNLADNTLVRLPIGTPATAPAAADITVYALPTPGNCPAASDVHWFATGVDSLDRVYVGGVCSAESTQVPGDMRAYVYRLDDDTLPGTFGLILDFALDYPRGCAVEPGCDPTMGVGAFGAAEWRPWSPVFVVTTTGFGGEVIYPQPMLTDIVFDRGDIILGLRDRFGDQSGALQLSTDPVDVALYAGDTAGDIIRACESGGMFTVESDGGCGGVTTNGMGTGQGPGGGEYYYLDNYPGHSEIPLGGLTQLPGRSEIVSTAYDPIFFPNEFFDGGVIWLNNDNGTRAKGYRIFSTDNEAPIVTFAKGGGVGDIEALCAPPPLEIGNRLWCDTDADGIQDPTEAVVSDGVMVTLTCDSAGDGLGVGSDLTATTGTVAGQYLFNLANVMGGVPPETVCRVEVALADAALVGSCGGVVGPAPPDRDPSGGVDLNADLRDSDGVFAGATVQIDFATGRRGENDHTRDFGFVNGPPAVVSLGDRVFYDTDQDGVQDAGEPGVPGVDTELFSDAVCTVTTGMTDTTDAAGLYGFDGLAAGTYCVAFTNLPAGFAVSPQDQGGADGTDSDPDPGTLQIASITLTFDDTTNDMGVFASGSIGDTVWCESSGGNSAFDPGEGVAGVSVSLFGDVDCDGASDGAAITSQDTMGDGQYLFGGLDVGPPGGPPICYVAKVDATDPDLGTCTIELTPTEFPVPLDADAPDDLDNDFGFEDTAAPTFSLGDFVWFDTDRDGVQDAMEPGVENVNIALYDNGTCAGMSMTMDSTDMDGLYGFAGLAAGTYCLEFSNLPAGHVISPINQGGDDTRDSDADPTTLQIMGITLGPDDPDEDVGIHAVGSIGDTVWCDGMAGNGTFEAGEGVANVQVSLFDDTDCDGSSDGPATAMQDTVGDGQYLFDDLFVGPTGDPICYVVEVDAADGDLGACTNPITPTSFAVPLTADAPDDLDDDFGFSEASTFSLGDFVWYDTDRDGEQDMMEPGVENVTVTLYDNGTCTAPSVTSDTTGPAGDYGFMGLAAGSYCVEFSTLPTGAIVTMADQGGDEARDSDADPTTLQITGIVLGPNDFDEDMGLYVPGSIGDTVWCDGLAGNGSFDAGEGMAAIGVSLFADTDCDGAADGGAVAMEDTVGDGQYLFDDLIVGPPGGPAVCYVVDVDETDPGLGLCSSPITALEHDVPLDADAPDDLDNDFGFSELPVFSLGDLVFFDSDQDGIQDMGEAGVAGVTVTLYDNATCSGASLDSDTTGAAGDYGFTGLLTGTYCLSFTDVPAGWTISPADQGGDDTRDSDADPMTGEITDIVLGPNDFDEDVGISVLGSIGDTVWCDGTAGNGVFDGGEGLAGIGVSLFADAGCDGMRDGVAIAMEDTVGDGQYLFDNLVVGAAGSPICYVVSVDDADPDLGGCNAPITPVEYAVPLDSDTPDDLDDDFGFADPRFTLGDFVWYDIDRDGVQDGGEPGVMGVTATLFDNGTCTGPSIDSDVTGGVGAYGFVDLAPGTYCIAFSNLPAGFLISPASQGGDDTRDSDANPITGQITGIVLGPDDPDEDLGVFAVGSIGDTVWCDGIAGNGTFEAGEGIAGVTATLFPDSDCNGTADGGAITMQDTIGDGMYLFTNLVVGPAGSPLCYVVSVDSADPALGSCDVPITPLDVPIPLDTAVPDRQDADIGFELVEDFGDAPASYGTTLPNGARHVITDGFRLGTEEDAEGDGQPNPAADGDDLAGVDDEDGVAFANAMAMAATCSTGNGLDVVLTNDGGGAAFLDGWIDYNGNGVFDHPAEHVFGAISALLVVGNNGLTYDVPCDARPGDVYARFRLSSTGGLMPTGAAADGEVEDYVFRVKGLDFGDAPDSYATTVAAGGARHTVDPSTPLFLGACVDTEADGQPVMPGDPADGDDNGAGLSDLGGCAGPDDEDGVTFDTMVVACGDADISVTASQAGLLDAWIDFDGDGAFAGSEQIFASQAVAAGSNGLTFAVPCATPTQVVTYARFRVSSVGGLGFGGPAMNGEVEDYAITTKGLDFGDAPSPYPTTLTDDGARHVVQPTGNPTLGTPADTEPDGQPDGAHAGDDQNGTPDDEDGVTFAGVFVPGGTAVNVTVTAGATGGLVDIWFDWNRDGDWNDPGEQVATSQPLGAGTSTVLSIGAPAGAVEGASCARARISSAGGLAPDGPAMDGEIEDYPVAIGVEDPAIGIAKEFVGVAFVGDGEYAVDFLVTVDNAGNVDLSNVQVDASLATAFADTEGYSVSLLSSADFTINPAYDGDGDVQMLTGTNSLAIGDMGVIVLQVIVRPGQNPGPYFCSSTARGDSPGGTPVDDDSQDGSNSDPDGDGDPTDNDDPTVVIVTLAPTDIPTLGEWSLMLLSMLLALAGLRAVRRI